MEAENLAIAGAVLFTPRQHRDARGVFLEQFRAEALCSAWGHPLTLAQSNVSVSRRGVVRGIHFAQVPPGQAKFVTCVKGRILDVAVDLRVGSPTFGQHVSAILDDVDRRALYVAEGLGHAFVALTDDATVSYYCSTVFNPEREHGIDPLDPDLALPWPDDLELVLSDRDRAAPSLGEVRAAGLLPDAVECEAFYERLRRAGSAGSPPNEPAPNQAGLGQ
jgi:dTDP-4-dehydrorhamnose 3,5-epimerase